MLEEQFDLVVHQLYGAVEHPAALKTAFDALAHGLGLDGWALVRLGDVVDVAVMGGPCWEADGSPQYLSCYEAIAPLAALAALSPVGEVLVSHAHFSMQGPSSGVGPAPADVPADALHWAMTWCAHHTDDQPHVACLLRAKSRGPFGLAECGLTCRFAGHLQQVLRLGERVGQRALQAAAAEAAVDSTALAVFGLDDSGRVRYANRRARGMAGTGRFLQVQEGHLCLPDADSQAWLLATLHGTGEPPSASTHLLRDAEGRSPEALTLIPLHGSNTAWLALLTPLHARRIATVRQLGQTFSLTPAEARLARALAIGASLESYADEARIKVTTAKAQLRSVMDKTGAERQSGVVRIVSALPPVRHGRDEQPQRSA